MRPLAPAPPSTVCRRLISPSTICTRKVWSAMKPLWRTPAIRTTSSSKCRVFIPQQTLRVSKWSKPDLAPEERKARLKSTTKTLPTGDVGQNDVSLIFSESRTLRFLRGEGSLSFTMNINFLNFLITAIAISAISVDRFLRPRRSRDGDLGDSEQRL